MATVVNARQSQGDVNRQAIGQGLANLIQSGTNSYMNRADEQALQNAIGGLAPNATPRQILDAITNTRTHSPEAKQTALKNYMGVAEFEHLQKKTKIDQQIAQAKNTISQNKETAKDIREKEKTNTERTNVKAIVNQLGLPEEQKNQLGETISQNAAEDLLKAKLKPSKEGKLSQFQKKVQEKNAEDYINLTKEIPKLDDTLANIDYAEKLSDELGYPGTIWGTLGISEKSKELQAISFPLIEPIVKTFNPSGPIAQQKLKLIQDKYQINSWDPPHIRKAKLKSLKRFAVQAKNRAQQRLDLIKKYDGNPPSSVIESFDKESDTMSDAMLDYDVSGEEANIPNLPPASEYKGEEIEGSGGKTYYSDGTRWLKR